MNASAWVRTIIAPKKMLIVASVTMKLCTPILVVSWPFSQPRKAPITMAPAMAGRIGTPTTCISQPPAMTDATPMEPTARLSPPVTSTTIIDRPMTMSMPMTRVTAKRLKTEVKPGLTVAKMTIRSAMTMARPASFEARSVAAPRLADSVLALANAQLQTRYFSLKSAMISSVTATIASW